MARFVTLPVAGPEVTAYLIGVIDSYWNNGGPNGRNALAPEVITFLDSLVDACLDPAGQDGTTMDADGDVVMGDSSTVPDATVPDTTNLPPWQAQALEASLTHISKTKRLRSLTLENGKLHYVFES